jgi:hypothetical protein
VEGSDLGDAGRQSGAGLHPKVIERRDAVKRYRNAPMDARANYRNNAGTLAAAMAALTFVTLPASATIYKCVGATGSPVYQDEPCPPGKELRDFDKDPPTVSVMPLTPPVGSTTRQVLPPSSQPKIKTGARVKAPQIAGNPTERKFLAPGINEGEVLTRVGPPDMKSGGNGRKIARWTYLPVPEDPGTITTLTFEHGRLVEVERKVVK